MYVAIILRVCIIGLLSVVGVLLIIITYHVFSIFQGNSNNFEHKNVSHQCWERE